MPSIKRKPIIYHSLPSLTTILQPLPVGTSSSHVPLPTQPSVLDHSLPLPSSPASTSNFNSTDFAHAPQPFPSDEEDEGKQFDALVQILEGKYPGAVLPIGGRVRKSLGGAKAEKAVVNGGFVGGGGVWVPPTSTSAAAMAFNHMPTPIPSTSTAYGSVIPSVFGNPPDHHLPDTLNGLVSAIPDTAPEGMPVVDTNPNQMPPPPEPKYWKVWDRECWYIPQSGEVFTDYE
jgi:hypothetical protein